MSGISCNIWNFDDKKKLKNKYTVQLYAGLLIRNSTLNSTSYYGDLSSPQISFLINNGSLQCRQTHTSKFMFKADLALKDAPKTLLKKAIGCFADWPQLLCHNRIPTSTTSKVVKSSIFSTDDEA